MRWEHNGEASWLLSDLELSDSMMDSALFIYARYPVTKRNVTKRELPKTKVSKPRNSTIVGIKRDGQCRGLPYAVEKCERDRC